MFHSTQRVTDKIVRELKNMWRFMIDSELHASYRFAGLFMKEVAGVSLLFSIIREQFITSSKGRRSFSNFIECVGFNLNTNCDTN